MPTYVYKFVETGETIEVQQSFTDDALTEAVHPTSGETMAVKKVFTPIGVTFKGGGFYKTDNRNGSKSGGSSSTSTKAEGSSAEKSGSTSTSSGSGESSSGSSPAPASAPSTSSGSSSSAAG